MSSLVSQSQMWPWPSPRSAIRFSATCQQGQKAQTARKGVNISWWGHLREVFCFRFYEQVRSTRELQHDQSLGVAAQVFVCLGHEVEFKLHSTVLRYRAHWLKSSRFPRATAAIPFLSEMDMERQCWVMAPADNDSPPCNDPDQLCKVKKERTGQRSKGYKTTWWIPQLKMFNNGQFLRIDNFRQLSAS